MNLLLAAAIGDISGVPYEFEGRTKNYDSIDLLNPENTYSDVPSVPLHVLKLF